MKLYHYYLKMSAMQGLERLIPYQPVDPSPTILTHRKKLEKGKTAEDKK